MRKRSVSTEKVVLTAKPRLHFCASKSTKGNKKPARVYLADLEGLVESEGAFVIAERASSLAEVERQHRKGGSLGKAVLAICASKSAKGNKKTLCECLFGRIEWTRTTDPHLIRVVL